MLKEFMERERARRRARKNSENDGDDDVGQSQMYGFFISEEVKAEYGPQRCTNYARIAKLTFKFPLASSWQTSSE